MSRFFGWIGVLVWLIQSPSWLTAQDTDGQSAELFFERYSDWPEELRIRGSLALTDSLDGLKHLLAENDSPRKKYTEWLIVGSFESASNMLSASEIRQAASELKKITWTPEVDRLKDLEPETLLIVCEDRLIEQIPQAEWSRLGETIQGCLSKGTMVAFVGPACVGLAERYLKSDSSGQFARGLGLVPDATIVFTEHGAIDRTVAQTIRIEDRGVLLSIAKGNAWVLQGRKGMLYGPGAATVWVGPCEHSPEASQRIQARSQANRNQPENFLLDWTQWRRCAIERTLEVFPPSERQRPDVPNGSLIIVGGGGMPQGLMQKFVELAGGPQARIVYVPCAEEEDMSGDTRLLQVWKQMGAMECTLVHTKDRRVANQDEQFLEPLKNATGIWFGGGRQWNLADSYYGTQAHRLMKQVLERGGVIAGSSAGASIQANYLARATPIENYRIMAPGYERGGLGFISGVAIDQHFTQRRRQKDLRSLVETYPQILGIGIDESTAIIVQHSRAEIVGPGTVTFQWAEDGRSELKEFVGSAGKRFDLAQRTELIESEQNGPDKTDSDSKP
jgi:cyanophycinase